MAERVRTPRINPFSTRFVRPGAISYLFEPGSSAADLIDRLAAHRWRGQIIGPHGCGKSTLLATLVDALARVHRNACVFSLRDRQRRMPPGWVAQVRRRQARLVVVDGFEQLSVARRTWVRVVCRRNGWGLVVTAHRGVGLPTLARLEPSVEVAREVVARLTAEDEVALDDRVVVECFAASGDNLRETLFALYDRYERQRRLHDGAA